ncbi:1-phosphofructokinase [Chthoniobacter flavus Ellin428]|uniref:1-phosphofructokinase n=1 Tax=Chthoniobacter flavus Ellin428 TaxID=497964 RepID=B4D0F8_9BACT|nr:1-phosphofructokinase [Chthoniobacter flavus]EDY19820.1 1-phosphofructokinase [Chthoniobacter flavus Ellin428]TCO91905.1 fructose-1-phosphate kinase [Chthoniobacter flavus]
MKTEQFSVVTVTLNPAIDRTVTIPNFTAGGVNRVETARNNAGGKGVNVAAMLAESGIRVAVTGFLGRENTSSFEELFSHRGIADHFVRVAGQTRTGIKVVDPVLHQTTDINFPGASVSAADLAAFTHRLDMLHADCFVLAGSLPPGADPGIYRELITRLRLRGPRIVLDASGEPLALALEARPNLIKPNIHELSELLGRPLPDTAAVVEAARELVSRGIETVVVSMGKDGACFVTAREAVVARPPRVEVRSTVGAGDAMVAGLVAAQFRQCPLADAARLATAFSVHALTRFADGAADFNRSIEALLSQVTVSLSQ